MSFFALAQISRFEFCSRLLGRLKTLNFSFSFVKKGENYKKFAAKRTWIEMEFYTLINSQLTSIEIIIQIVLKSNI